MEKQLIKKIGDHLTEELIFTNDFNVTNIDGDISAVISFYTYNGELFILTEDGMDTPFSEFNEESKDDIFREIMNGNYEFI